MEAYVADWLNIVARWVHFVTGIAWIGSSFYFIWLDNSLEAPREGSDRDEGIAGELWSVHGGGFYHSRKFRLAPTVLPATLHWFKWEAYTTWISGMFLLALVYWYGAGVYLVDPAVRELSAAAAVAIAVGFLVLGWVFYDLLCRSPLARREGPFAAVLLVAVTLLAWALCQLYSGRGAYIHFGAVLGTIMVANVFFVIIPGQRRMVEAFARGETPDPEDGIRGKQRSVHNTYFTLPVLFAMTSNHYALTYSHRYNWLILAGMALVGALVRVYFVARQRGRASPLPLVAAGIVLLITALALAPRSRAGGAEFVTLDMVRPVIEARCVACHAAEPSHIAFPAPPAGVVLDSDAQILAEATRIHQQTVLLRSMPIGNLTAISDEERALIDAWYRSLDD